eukprot:4589023-Prymnesium_polylepis.1
MGCMWCAWPGLAWPHSVVASTSRSEKVAFFWCPEVVDGVMISPHTALVIVSTHDVGITSDRCGQAAVAVAASGD